MRGDIAEPDIPLLGPSGPFDHTTRPVWFHQLPSHVRVLDLVGYRDAMVATGTQEAEADRTTARLRDHGVTAVLWAGAHGGRRGFMDLYWDVRMAETAGPAADVVRLFIDADAVVPASALNPGLRKVAEHHHVLGVASGPVPQRVERLPAGCGPRWSRLLRLPARITYGAGYYAHVAMAHDRMGATVFTCAPTKAEAEWAAAKLASMLWKCAAEPYGGWGRVMPPSWTARWWRRHSRTRLPRLVGPPSAQCVMWWASVHTAG